MAVNTSNPSSEQRRGATDLKMDSVNFEPTFIVTRREYTRNILSKKFAEDVKRKLNTSPINNNKNLQGCKVVHDADLYVKNRRNDPLHGDESNDFSHWRTNAHPTRRYRRTFEFTKPDTEYFGTSQWR